MVSTILPEHLIAEMRHDVATEDALKARLVLSHLHEIDQATQHSVLEALASGAPAFALPLLVETLVRQPWIDMAQPQVREWIASLAAASPDEFLRLLRAEHGAALAVMATVAGELGMEAALPALLAAVRDQTSPLTLESVIEALGRIGGDEAVDPISEFLYSNSEALITVAARALAVIGTPDAVEKLAQRIGHEAHLDEIFIGLLWEIQSQDALKALAATLASSHAHVRSFARQALFLSGVTSIPVLLDNLRTPDDDVLIHSLDILGDIGDEAAYNGIRQLLHRHPANPNVRFSAYDALGKLPMQGRGFALASGLEDPVENVRVAAASAIERNLDPVLAAGVKNLTSSGDGNDRKIVRALVTARSLQTLLSLTEDEHLRALVADDLRDRADPEVQGWFAEKFNETGHAGLAPTRAAVQKRPRVYAVDDSIMVLSIYRSALHGLGFDPVVHAYPAQAIEAILAEPPSAVLTDLNMPEITGIELIRQLRERYPRNELPIIMVTTQQSAEDDREALDAGADAVIRKPFTPDDLSRALAAAGVHP